MISLNTNVNNNEVSSEFYPNIQIYWKGLMMLYKIRNLLLPIHSHELWVLLKSLHILKILNFTKYPKRSTLTGALMSVAHNVTSLMHVFSIALSLYVLFLRFPLQSSGWHSQNPLSTRRVRHKTRVKYTSTWHNISKRACVALCVCMYVYIYICMWVMFHNNHAAIIACPINERNMW